MWRFALFSTVVAASVLFAGSSSAAVLHLESIDGDFSDDSKAPTPLRAKLGSNIVGGTSNAPNATSWDADFFTLTVSEPWLLSRLDLEAYQQSAPTPDEVPGQLADRGAFLAVERGSVFADPKDGDEMIGAGLIGVQTGRRVGDDLLVALGVEQDYWEKGFVPPLPAGEYTFWYQQTRGSTEYTFDFVVTPLPAALPLFAGASGILAWMGWRRRHSRQATPS